MERHTPDTIPLMMPGWALGWHAPPRAPVALALYRPALVPEIAYAARRDWSPRALPVRPARTQARANAFWRRWYVAGREFGCNVRVSVDLWPAPLLLLAGRVERVNVPFHAGPRIGRQLRNLADRFGG
jgi:hypothetical protein